MRWEAKAALQGVLSVVPFGRAINLFLQERLGQLAEWRTSDTLGPLVSAFAPPLVERYGDLNGLRVVEIGTGWMPVLPVTLGMLGCHCRTFDVMRHLTPGRAARIASDVEQELVPTLERHQLKLRIARPSFAPEVGMNGSKHPGCVNEVLEPAGVRYEAPVDTTALPVADESQDAVVSNLTLQHIRPAQLESVIREHFRVVAPGGRAIHRIRLHDEYASVDPRVTNINFLRYPAWLWEAVGSNRIKHVNRERYPYYLSVFERAGFRLAKMRRTVDEDARQALPRMKLAPEFQGYSDDVLCTVQMTVVLDKPARATSPRDGERRSER